MTTELVEYFNEYGYNDPETLLDKCVDAVVFLLAKCQDFAKHYPYVCFLVKVVDNHINVGMCLTGDVKMIDEKHCDRLSALRENAEFIQQLAGFCGGGARATRVKELTAAALLFCEIAK